MHCALRHHMALTALQALRGIYAGIGGHRPARRVHYIAAERVTWDYAPRASEGNLCGPQPVPFNPAEVSFWLIYAPRLPL